MVNQVQPKVEAICRSCKVVFEPLGSEMECSNCKEIKPEVEVGLGFLETRALNARMKRLYKRIKFQLQTGRFLEAHHLTVQIFVLIATEGSKIRRQQQLPQAV